jgi:hypothetical protein
MKPNLPMRIIGWIFTLLSGAFLGWIFFEGRETVMTVTMLFTRNAYLPRAVDKIYLVLIGVVWLVAWVYLEWYTTTAVEKHRLWAAVLRVSSVELILFFMLTVVPMIFSGSGVDWPGVGRVTTALIAGVGLLLLSRRMLSRQVSARV